LQVSRRGAIRPAQSIVFGSKSLPKVPAQLGSASGITGTWALCRTSGKLLTTVWSMSPQPVTKPQFAAGALRAASSSNGAAIAIGFAGPFRFIGCASVRTATSNASPLVSGT
jgi:hypothetical protein